MPPFEEETENFILPSLIAVIALRLALGSADKKGA